MNAYSAVSLEIVQNHTTKHMKKIYFACSLAHASQEFLIKIEEYKKQLGAVADVLQFMGTEKGTAQDVFKFDLEQVKLCDMVIAECSNPSTGLGFELGVAYYENIPILAIAESSAKVSRMIEGIDHPHFSFHRYTDFGEVIEFVRGRLNA